MASATMAGRSGPGLQVGSALSRAGTLWAKLIGPLFLLFVLQSVPTLVVTTSVHTATAGRGLGAVGVPMAIAFLLSGIISIVTHGASYVATSRVMEGGTADVPGSIQTGMGRFFPLFGAWFCVGVLTMVGMILLVVPGVIAALACYVVGPVCVLDRLGPVPSINRSFALTKGSRWKLLALGLVIVVLGVVVQGVLLPARVLLGPVGAALVQALLTAGIGVYGVVLATVVYRDLVDGSEGFGGQRLAAVFD